MRALAQREGVFGEPAGVAGLAGLRKLLRQSSAELAGERIVVLVTGNGLKDVESAIRGAPEPSRINPNPAALDALGPDGLLGG